jgi:TRAP-type C4-dicarboxylate transport system permease small subunit
MDSRKQSSPFRRAVFSLFLAIVACGMSFYLILFVSLTVMSVTHHANPAETPGLQAALRDIVLPISVGVSAVTFFLSFWGLRRRDLVAARTEKQSNKAAV